MRVFFLLCVVLAAPLSAQTAAVYKLLEEYQGKYAALAKDDVTARRELAKWCAGKKLRQRERALNAEIVKLDPKDEAARKALGHVKDGEVWYESNDALQRAKGKLPLLKEWAPADAVKLTLVHGHYLSAEELAQLDKGEPLQGHTLPEGTEFLTREHLIVSALEPAKSLDIARVLDQAYRQWRDAANLIFDPGKRQTLRVRILKNTDAFVAMIKDDIETFDQQLIKALGYYDGVQCWGSFAFDWYRTRRVLLHEARHQFDACIARNMMQMPGWYMEGIAEYWSVHTWDGKTLVSGALNADDNENLFYAVKFAKSGKLKGAEETLLHPTMETISPAFYQNAWAFIYFIRTSKTYADGFKKWEAELLAGKYETPEAQLAGFKEHVAKDLKAFDKAYRAEIKSMADLVPDKWK